MRVTDQGVPVDELIRVVKDSVQAAGVSRTSQARDLQVTSVRLILEVVASKTAGGRLDFRVPVHRDEAPRRRHGNQEDTHTIDMTLVPKEERRRSRRRHRGSPGQRDRDDPRGDGQRRGGQGSLGPVG